MGLDVGFYDQDEMELLYFRNHHELLSLFFAEPHVTLVPDDDFYVTQPMVTSILAKIEAEMAQHGLPCAPLAERQVTCFEDFFEEVPETFFHREPEDWVEALPHYRVLLTRLRALVRAEGVLICGWGA